jgi:hypothetical protein
MKAVLIEETKEVASSIDKLRDLLMLLVETSSHELPDEALQSKRLVKDYFFSDSGKK